MKILKKIWNWCSEYKVVGLLLVAVVAVAYFFPHHALAEATTAQDTKETVEQSIATLMTIVMQFLNMLLWPFLLVIGDLMDTDLITGPGMGDSLKAIWIPIRDLVNIAFVIVLLVVAIYNVLGLGGGEGDLAIKTALPKIVIGLVLVNFTLPIGRVILDLANVGTTAVFALPEIAADTQGGDYDFSSTKNQFVINVCYKDYDEATSTPTYYNETTDGENVPIYTKLFCEKDADENYSGLSSTLEAKYFQDLNANNVGLVMAVNMGGLSGLSLLKEGAIDSFSTLTISVMFAVLMYLVFAVSYVVLGIVLLTRLVVLWIALALSPLAVLVYVVPQVKEWAGGGGEFSQKIMKHLIAPIIIGATMSLGWLLIDAWNGLTQDSSLTSGGFEVDQVISGEFLISGISDLPRLIIALATIIIVWTGVFAAANDTYASFATKSIEEFGTNVKNFALKLPSSLPYVPLSVPGEAAEKAVSPMALKLWAESQMSNVTNGSWALDQLKNEDGTSRLPNFFGSSGTIENRSPEFARDQLRQLSRGNEIDYNRASEIAKHLITTIDRGNLSAGEKARLSTTLREYQERYARGDNTLSLDELREIVDQNDAGKLGLSETEYGEFKSNVDRARWNPTNAPNAPTPPAAAPAPAGALHASVPPIETQVAALATPATNTAANRSAAQAAITTARGTVPATDTASLNTLKALEDVITAEEAVQTALAVPAPRPAGWDTAARAAIAAARTSATTAGHAASTARLTALESSL